MVRKESPDIPALVEALMVDLPEEMRNNFEDAAKRLLSLPLKIDRDLAMLLVFAAEKPKRLQEELYHLPGRVPDNIDAFLQTVLEGVEYGDLDEGERGERLRRITDLIDLFTPT